MLHLLLACTSPSPAAGGSDDADTAAGDTAGVDTAPTGPDIPAPALSAAEVGAALEAALAWEIPTFPTALSEFQALMDQGEGCTPDARFFEILDAGGCLAPSGITYSGAGGAVGGWDDLGTVFFYELRGDLVITDAEGYPYEVGGDIDTEVSRLDGGGLHFSQQFLGSFKYPPVPLWLGVGTSGSAWVEADFWDDGAIEAQVDGGYDLDGADVYFDALTVGGTCGEAPTGAIRLRDVSGYWYVFTYGAGCDSCGEVTYATGEVLGTACVDVAPAMRAMATGVQDYILEHPGGAE